MYIEHLAFGGAERTFLNLAKGFVNQGAIVHLVIGFKNIKFDEELSGINFASLDIMNDIRSRRRGALRTRIELIWSLRFFIRRYQPDVSFTTILHNNINLGIAWRLSGKVGECVLRETNHRPRSEISDLINQTRKIIYNSVSCVVALSWGVKGHLVNNGIDEKNVSVIYNPVDLKSISKLSNIVDGLPILPHKYIVIVGRLQPVKNHIMFFNVIKEIIKYDNNIKGVVVGDGNLRDELESYTEEIGISDFILFVGHQNNPYPIIKKAHILLLTSLYEGFGHVIAESMACGTPVISCDCPSGPGEIISNGETGFLVPVNDVIKMSNYVRLLSDNPKQRGMISSKGAMSVKRFGLETICDDYLELFRTCIMNKKGVKSS